VTFPVFIDCVYQQGRCDEHGWVARHGYAADAPFIDTPRDARNHYSKRFGIESSYRLAKQSPRVHQFSGCWTAAGDVCSEPIASRNSWRYLHWRYVARPRGAPPLEMVVHGVL